MIAALLAYGAVIGMFCRMGIEGGHGQNHDAIDQRIAEVRDNVLQGRPEKTFNAPADPYDIRHFESDQMKEAAKRPEDWTKVMEHHNFKWYPAEELNRLLGGQIYIPTHLEGVKDGIGRDVPNSSLYQRRKRTEGQWRNDFENPRLPEKLKLAFTLKDLITGFETPEAFDKWIRQVKMRFSAAHAGIVLPK